VAKRAARRSGCKVSSLEHVVNVGLKLLNDLPGVQNFQSTGNSGSGEGHYARKNVLITLSKREYEVDQMPQVRVSPHAGPERQPNVGTDTLHALSLRPSCKP
jgi:hypothetical protein